MYGLDLMGSWGGEEDWTTAGNQWSNEDHGQWDNGQLRSLQPGYSRSVAMHQPVQIAISDRYSAIAFGAAWLALQTWFTLRARHLKMMARPREETLDGNPEFLTLWKPNDEPHLLARANRAAKKVGKRAKEAGKQAKRRILPPA